MCIIIFSSLINAVILLLNCRGNFTLPVWDLPYLIIAGNCEGNMKLN